MTVIQNLATTVLAAGGGSQSIQAEGWLLSNAWLIPAIMACSFLAILFFGKRGPRGGSEVGIAAVVICFVLSLLTAGQWIGQVNRAGNCEPHKDSAGHYVCQDGTEVLDSSYGYEVASSYGKDAYTDDAHAKDDHAKDDHASDSYASDDHGAEATHGEDSHAAEVAARGVVSKRAWWTNGGKTFTVGTMVDGLTVALLVVVTLISSLVHIYSTDYVAGDRRYTHFFAFLSLFTAAMLFFVLSENTLQMIVGWELVGVCSFSLIGHWWEEKENSNAALKAFLTNRVGDMGLLIGMILLFFASGQTWSILDINHAAITGATSHTMLLIASLCLIAAVMSKSGQFFLHTWLPDAMAGPTPVSALIHAATMVVAGIYLVARLYGVFFHGLSISGSSINALALVGAITTLVGASLAFVQDDIKKVLAYSTISQLGYMALALGVGAWTAAIFHMFTHAFFKALLFLGAGSVSHAVHSFDMKKDMGGMRKYMPTTYKTFLIGSIALAGLPPLAGFWSKDEILVGTGGWAFFRGEPHANGAYTAMLIMGMITAAMTAAYMTRVMYLTFFGEFRGGHHDDHAHDSHDAHSHHGEPHESGPRILWPLRILAVLAVGAGFLNLPPGFLSLPSSITERFGHYVEPKAATGYFPAINHATPSWSLAIVSTLIVSAGIYLAYRYYFIKVNQQDPASTELWDGLTSRVPLAKAAHTLLKNKYYLDHIYDSGEAVPKAGARAVAFLYGTAAGATLGLSLGNGLDLSTATSTIWGVVGGASIFALVYAALSTGVGIAKFTRKPLAWAANWVHENIIDGAVDEVGKTSVSSAQVVYKYIDQGGIDTVVNAAGRGSSGAGSELTRLSTGKVQQYGMVMFVGAALLAAVMIIVI